MPARRLYTWKYRRPDEIADLLPVWESHSDGKSEANRNAICAQMSIKTIGHDKVKQWVHAKYLKNMDGIHAHMAKHAALIRPKFEAVQEILEEEITPLGIGTWRKPNGGYFICFETLRGCAKAVIAKAKEAGVALTAAGAPFPYGIDPKDSVIRIAPTFPNIDEIKQAAKVLCTDMVKNLKGNHTPAIIAAVYGNRHYDDALLQTETFFISDSK